MPTASTYRLPAAAAGGRPALPPPTATSTSSDTPSLTALVALAERRYVPGGNSTRQVARAAAPLRDDGPRASPYGRPSTSSRSAVTGWPPAATASAVTSNDPAGTAPAAGE